MPLYVADPQGGARQFGGVVADFQPHHLTWSDLRRFVVPSVFGQKQDGFLFQAQERFQDDVQEVTATAGRVQHGRRCQPGAERADRIVSARPVAGGEHPFRGGARRLPLAPQRAHHYRLYNQHDVVVAGVVRAQFGPFGRVEGALEQRSEDGWLDITPVLVGGFAQPLQRLAGQLHNVVVVEQVAVEVVNPIHSEKAAGGHLAEQAGDRRIECRRVAAVFEYHAGEQTVG